MNKITTTILVLILIWIGIWDYFLFKINEQVESTNMDMMAIGSNIWNIRDGISKINDKLQAYLNNQWIDVRKELYNIPDDK